MYFMKLHWRTLITNYNHPHKFIDQQIKGPYSLWHHTHIFQEKNVGTLIQDEVTYAIPFGLIGRLIHAIYIKYDLRSIFKYTHKILNKIFLEIKENARK